VQPHERETPIPETLHVAPRGRCRPGAPPWHRDRHRGSLPLWPVPTTCRHARHMTREPPAALSGSRSPASRRRLLQKACISSVTVGRHDKESGSRG